MFHLSVATTRVAANPPMGSPEDAGRATTVAVNLDGIGNLQPLELLAEVASRQAPMAMQATPPSSGPMEAEAAFAEYLRWCDPALGVALEWAHLPPLSRGLTKDTLASPAAAAGIPPPWRLIRQDGQLSDRGETVLRYAQAAFDFSCLPGDRKCLDTVSALAGSRGLNRHALLRYVPARELLPGLAVDARDEAARRAANLAVLHQAEQARPDFAQTKLWKAVVAWCEKPDRARREADRWLFAFAQGVQPQLLIRYVTAGGDLTAYALEVLERHWPGGGKTGPSLPSTTPHAKR